MKVQVDEVCKVSGGYFGPLMAWFVLLGGGLAMMAGFAYSPGAIRDAGPVWPGGMTFTPAGDRPTLVVALHPRCTCSVATVRELSRLLSAAVVQPHIEILLYRPNHVAEGWDRAAFDEELRRIPRVTVRGDVEGRQARAFGMLTSGDVALFTSDGHLRFRGGVTSARGHEGESDGGRRLRRALSEGHSAPGAIPVFGCPLESGD